MLDLEYVKKHLNIDETFVDDDTYIMSLIEMSESMILLSLDLEDDSSVYDEEVESLKGPLVLAQLLLIGNWYANREAVTFGQPHELPLGFEYILQRYKSYVY